MFHPLYKIESFQIVAPYTLRIRFEDGAERTIDFRAVLHDWPDHVAELTARSRQWRQTSARIA